MKKLFVAFLATFTVCIMQASAQTSVYVQAEKNTDTSEDYGVRTLNNWLKNNPDKRIVTFTARLTRTPIETIGFWILCEPKEQGQVEQTAIYAKVEKDSTSTEDYGLRTLNNLLKNNPGRRIVAFTARVRRKPPETIGFLAVVEPTKSDQLTSK